jgi:hypothetical protein
LGLQQNSYIPDRSAEYSEGEEAQHPNGKHTDARHALHLVVLPGGIVATGASLLVGPLLALAAAASTAQTEADQKDNDGDCDEGGNVLKYPNEIPAPREAGIAAVGKVGLVQGSGKTVEVYEERSI